MAPASKTPRTWGERLLFSLSRHPESNDYRPEHVNYTLDNALALLQRVFPDFVKAIAGKHVLDFGCGSGYQTVALALIGAARVVGLDSNPVNMEEGWCLASRHGVTDIVEFVSSLDDRFVEKFDVVISKDSMEHFSDPASVLDAMKRALRPDGTLMITFGPPWLAPYGGHMHFFTKLPWVHLLFPERTVLRVRAQFRKDNARKYEEVEGGLNRMTVTRFERLISQKGFKTLYRNDEYVKRLIFLGKMPWVREFLVNQVSCILKRN